MSDIQLTTEELEAILDRAAIGLLDNEEDTTQ